MQDTINFNHKPVLLEETINSLQIKSNGRYLDLTLGGAGHSSEILQNLKGSGELFAFDQDAEALFFAKKKLEQIKKTSGSSTKLVFFHDNFSKLETCISQYEKENETQIFFDGILADIGVSSYQLDEADRGFSYSSNGPLDMRMDKRNKLTAADIVNTYSEKDLADLIYKYGEEKNSRRIAKNIVDYRRKKLFETTWQLSDCIMKSQMRKDKSNKHPAKRTFQALRIAVNAELDVLEAMLVQALNRLNSGGRLSIITFHSLEDRIVKNFFKEQVHRCTCPAKMPCICGRESLGKIIEAKGLVASAEELKQNLRSRSARLRTFEKF